MTITGQTLPDLRRIFGQLVKTSMAIQFQYRASNYIWLIGAILEPTIYLIVWSTVAEMQGGSVNGMTAQDFAAYYIILMVINQWTFTYVMWQYEYFIRDGTLANWLMRPIHPIWRDLADNITYKLFTAVLLIPAALVLVLLFRPTFHTNVLAMLAFLPAFFLAFALRFTLDWGLALSAFWTTRTSALNNTYFVVFLFFSGRIAPLNFFPEWVQTLATLLPFRWMLQFPLDLFLGNLQPSEIWTGYAMQALWLVFSVTAIRFIWPAGIRRFASVGG